MVSLLRKIPFKITEYDTVLYDAILFQLKRMPEAFLVFL